MNSDKIENYLAELCDNTDFSFSIEEIDKNRIVLSMDGDNPENEDWFYDLEIGIPKCKKELINLIYEKVREIYESFDIEEEVYLMLDAKRNGFEGVPGVVALVHNEEYKENALYEFIRKLQREVVNCVSD